jgi:hypothetical protein
VLRWHHVLKVMLQRLFEDITLRLPILLGHSDHLFIEASVDLWSELFDGTRHNHLLHR